MEYIFIFFNMKFVPTNTRKCDTSVNLMTNNHDVLI